MNTSPSTLRGALRSLVALGLATAAYSNLHAQGCVPVKQMGDISCSLDGLETNIMSKWSVNFNYQGFRSHRHFVGHEEQVHRAEQGTEVVNVVNQVNTAITYTPNSRWSYSVNIPYFHAERSSLYEHDRVNRYWTSAKGLGDISVGAQYWLRSTMSEAKQNIAFGLSLQMPTGQTNLKDDFHSPNGIVRRNVDQSIQPGIGGWGIAASFQGYQRLAEATTLYATGYYMVMPQEMNGTYRSTNPITGKDSIFDSYNWRIGVSQIFVRRHGFTGSLGMRGDGVPAIDLFGSSAGFRRPGYTISVEPALSFMATPHDSFSLSVPIAVERSRSKSYADMQTGRHGDAAFADFLINFNYSHHW